MPMLLKGSCHCGAVGFEVESHTPVPYMYCYCTICRKQQNTIRRLKPRIMVILNPDKSVVRRPRTLDLIMNPNTATGEPYRIVRSLPMNAYGINPADFYLG
jgi:hypothetical protein